MDNNSYVEQNLKDFENYLDGFLNENEDNSGKSGKRKLESWLNGHLKIRMTDGRVLIGVFLCTDRDANVILGSCSEYLSEEDCLTEDPRILGLVMVPGRHIISIHKDSIGARKKRWQNPFGIFTRNAPFKRFRSSSDTNTTNLCQSDPCKDLRDVKMDIFCKVAIVTGGGTGIGYASAYELLNNGAKLVVIAHQSESRGIEAAKCLCDQFGMNKAIYLPCDIRCPKQFEDVFLNTMNCTQKIDIVLNNAGVIDDKNWESSVATNVIGTLRGNLLAMKYMEGHNSVVINMCATAGLVPWPNCPIFAASKHSVVTASRCFGDTFHFKKTKIRVMGLCPGYTNTNIWNKAIARHLEPQWGKETMYCLQNMRMQSASLVGKAVVHLIKYGKSGKIYVCDNGILQRAAFPRVDDVICAEPLT